MLNLANRDTIFAKVVPNKEKIEVDPDVENFQKEWQKAERYKITANEMAPRELTELQKRIGLLL